MNNPFLTSSSPRSFRDGMDENHIYSSGNHISSLLLGHIVSSSSANTTPPAIATIGCSSAFAYVARDTHQRESSLPFSSYSLEGVQMPSVLCAGGGASAAESLSIRFNPASLLQKETAYEADRDGYNSESEEGVDVAEESRKPITAHRPGSKRSRAAEVHNLSEKRRRSRINEKMKALQKLVPNSNKTDKASMLDEAIDYLKQLQLQVQMLSIRNGLNIHPVYVPGTLQPVQASQMHSETTGDNTTQINGGVGMLPISQEASTRDSFDLPSQCTHLRQPLATNISYVNGQVTRFEMEAQRSQHGSFHLALAEGRYNSDDMVARQQLNPDNSAGARLC